MGMRFGTWNVRSLCTAGSLKVTASEMAKYNLDVVAVQEVRRLRIAVSQQTIMHFFIEMGMLIIR
jgi:exonuclease III